MYSTANLRPPVKGETLSSQLFTAYEQDDRQQISRVLPGLTEVLHEGDWRSRTAYADFLTSVAERLSSPAKRLDGPLSAETDFSLRHTDFTLARDTFALVGESLVAPPSAWRILLDVLRRRKADTTALENPSLHKRVVDGFVQCNSMLSTFPPTEQLLPDLLSAPLHFLSNLNANGFSMSGDKMRTLYNHLEAVTTTLTERAPELVARTLSENVFASDERMLTHPWVTNTSLEVLWKKALVKFGTQGEYEAGAKAAEGMPDPANVKPNLVEALKLAARTVGVTRFNAQAAARMAFDELVQHHILTSPNPMHLADFSAKIGLADGRFATEHFNFKLGTVEAINQIRRKAALNREIVSAAAINNRMRSRPATAATAG